MPVSNGHTPTWETPPLQPFGNQGRLVEHGDRYDPADMGSTASEKFASSWYVGGMGEASTEHLILDQGRRPGHKRGE
jgi:hypothetical protein